MVDTMIVYVHGAFSSQRSWYDIHRMVRSTSTAKIHNHFFEYDIQKEDAFEITRQLVVSVEAAAAKVNPTRILLVGHSYGGVLCVAASHYIFDEIPTSIVTMSSPFAGTHFSLMITLFIPPLLKSNISYDGRFIESVTSYPLQCPMHSFITTGGRVAWIAGPNDGIVCVRSQSWFTDDKNSTHDVVEVNHFDILHQDIVGEKISAQANSN